MSRIALDTSPERRVSGRSSRAQSFALPADTCAAPRPTWEREVVDFSSQ